MTDDSSYSSTLPDSNVPQDILDESTVTPTRPPAQPAGQYLTVSTAFYIGRPLPPPNDHPPDTVIYSLPDSIVFHVHRRRINYTGVTLMDQVRSPQDPMIILDEPAETVNCMLHILYGFSCRDYSPTLLTFSAALSSLDRYGFTLADFITPRSRPLDDLLALSDDEPLGVFVLAASWSLEALAVKSSTAALSVPISDIPASSAAAMGPIYLLRLVKLHDMRKEAMKRLLLISMEEHADTPGCDIESRRSTARAYALSASYLAWQVVPHADRDWILRGLSPLLTGVSCRLCEANLRIRIQSVVDEWDRVKDTI